MLPKRILLADVSDIVVRAVDTYKQVRYPCDLIARATDETYDFSYRMDLAGVFRAEGRRVLYPRVGADASERNQASAAEYRAWERYARRRGEFEHYEYPALLAKLYSDIRSVFLPRGCRPAIPDRTPDSIFAPIGPWTAVPHAPTDYALEARMHLDRKAVVDVPLAQLFDRLLAEIWIIEPQDIRITYTPSA